MNMYFLIWLMEWIGDSVSSQGRISTRPDLLNIGIILGSDKRNN